MDHGSISIYMMDTEKWLTAFNEIASAWHLKPLSFYCIGISAKSLSENLLCNAHSHSHTAVAKLVLVIQVHVYALACVGGKDHEVR